MYSTLKYSLIFTLCAASFSLAAQTDTTLHREVEVTKAYKPTISDAQKLNVEPPEENFDRPKLSFEYPVKSSPILNTFSVNTLKPALVETERTFPPGYGMASIGLGSYLKPYAEIFLNNANTKNTFFGIHGRHLSSFGNLKLEGGDKVDAPFSESELELFTKRIVANSMLSINGSLNHNSFEYYGYPETAIPTLLSDNLPAGFYQGEKQAFTKASLHIDLAQPSAAIDEESTGFSFDYHYFNTKTGQKEHFIEGQVNFRREMNSGMGILNAGLRTTSANNLLLLPDSTMGKRSQTWLYAQPAWFTGNENANATLGANLWFVMANQRNTVAKISPNIRAQWAPVPEIIKVFAIIDGDYTGNHYSKISYETPYVNPLHDAQNSFKKIRLLGGFDGAISPTSNFKLSAEYAITSDQLFYYLRETQIADTENNPVSVINNTFDIGYDKIKRFALGTEFYYNPGTRFNLIASFYYFSYQTTTQDQAWNLPKWESTITGDYRVNDQLSIQTNLQLYGKRNGLILSENNSTNTTARQILALPAIVDLNAKVNYRLTGKMSAFAQLNNLAFQHYQIWPGYPVQSFNLLCGINYTF